MIFLITLMVPLEQPIIALNCYIILIIYDLGLVLKIIMIISLCLRDVCMQAAKSLASLRICTGSPEASAKSCADSESFARGGPALTRFFMRGERI